MKRILLFLLFLGGVEAKDFGVMGECFPVEEKSILEVIRSRVESLSEVDIALLQESLKEKYENHLNHPPEVEGLSKANQYEVHYFDPTVRVHQDIKDHNDTVIIPKGTKYNPLTASKLNQELLFFDGTDKSQIEWAKSQKGAWILVKGKPLELEKNEETPVFFDQRGSLTKKFKITKIPTKVSQEGKYLKIEAFPIGGIE